VLLLTSWAWVWLLPSWHVPFRLVGIPVKDVIAQSTIFLICAFGLIWCACDSLRDRNWWAALWPAGLSALFVANLVFVAVSRADVIVAPFLVVLLGWRQFGWKGATIALMAGSILAAGALTSSPYLRTRLVSVVADIRDYQANNATNDVGTHVEFLIKSTTFVRGAPLVGHGTGSIADLFRRSVTGQTGAAALATDNPHSQIFAVAIQLGLLGTGVLMAMWIAHFFLFREPDFTAWIGTLVVVENVISSLTSSHLFDFMHGWLYVLGVGVAGGMTLRLTSTAQAIDATHADATSDTAGAALQG
jgi:O-antigen ligase